LRSVAFCASLIAFLAAAGCDRAPPADAPAGSAGTEYMAVGTLNSVDRTAGTVNISHNPVPAAGWPAMTMDFKLTDPDAARDLEPGERVDLHFTIESGMNATITHIAPIE
jgi:Cu(I)/Ag(I) efflux system membrane fusion protein